VIGLYATPVPGSFRQWAWGCSSWRPKAGVKKEEAVRSPGWRYKKIGTEEIRLVGRTLNVRTPTTTVVECSSRLRLSKRHARYRYKHSNWRLVSRLLVEQQQHSRYARHSPCCPTSSQARPYLSSRLGRRPRALAPLTILFACVISQGAQPKKKGA
jgi:hypothetical protein